MAGNYPNVPSWRMAIDRDGTQVYTISSSNVVSQCSSGQITALNSEGNTGIQTNGQNDSGKLLIMFPEKRDLDGYFCNIGYGSFINGSLNNLEVSSDSTNGIDGTWVSISRSFVNTPTQPAYRTSIAATTQLGIKAIRWSFNSGAPSAGCYPVIHLYGEISPAENPNRLALWHPTLDQRITPAYFDWGNVPRSSSADLTFRVKNLSTVQTANSIRVAQEILTDTAPSVVGQHTLSSDGATFLAQVNVGALAPGAISGVVTLRRVTPSNAVLSVWCHRVFAEATTWS